MEIALQIAVGLVVFLAILLIGLLVKPSRFPDYTGEPGEVETIALPAGLPAPVERYYRAVYGDSIPVIKSVVLSGRAFLKPAGPVMLPARFRFTHAAGKDYRHYIETTFYNLPFLKVNERYLDGKGLMELPFGTDEGDKLDQAANLGLWAETAWFPAVFLTTPGVSWLPVDGNTAQLVVPFNQGTDSFIVRFNPDTGFADYFEAMRYHDSKSVNKVLWINHTEAVENVDGKVQFVTGSATWMDDGKPWAFFTMEDMILNADVSEYLQQKGI
jgi:hypothetical protein